MAMFGKDKEKKLEVQENKMNKQVCALCKKPMRNSLASITFTLNSDYSILVHTKCQKLFDCRNCLSMIIRHIEGKCVCGNIIQLDVGEDRYRIIDRD